MAQNPPATSTRFVGWDFVALDSLPEKDSTAKLTNCFTGFSLWQEPNAIYYTFKGGPSNSIP
jgi:hypothetical protein